MSSEQFKTLCKHVDPKSENYQKILTAMMQKDFPKLTQDAIDAVLPPKSYREQLKDRLRSKIGRSKEIRSSKKTQEELMNTRQQMLDKFAENAHISVNEEKKKKNSLKKRQQRLRKRYGTITEEKYLESLNKLKNLDNLDESQINQCRNIVRVYQDQQAKQDEDELILSD